MKLFVTCSGCHKDIQLKQKADTKFEFQSLYGDKIEVNCPNCGSSNQRHVNRTFAKLGWYWILIGFGISIIVSIILTIMIGGIALLFISLPGVIAYGRQQSIKAYNIGMVKRQ